MANIFEHITLYPTKWNVVETRSFSEEEKAQVKGAVVVPSQYGLSMCFTMVSGGMSFIPISPESTMDEGEVYDLDQLVIVQLHKEGEQDIYRIDVAE